MRFSALVILLAVLLGSAPLSAQQAVTFDVRGVAAMNTEDLVDADLGGGFGFGAVVAVRVLPHLNVYGGWDWIRFTPETSFAGSDRDFEETGYTFGLRFEHPFTRESTIRYRLEGGGVYKHVEIENQSGDLLGDSDLDLGFELGAGLVLPLGVSWALTPVARFRSSTPEVTVGSNLNDGTVRYVAFELGLSRGF